MLRTSARIRSIRDLSELEKTPARFSVRIGLGFQKSAPNAS